MTQQLAPGLGPDDISGGIRSDRVAMIAAWVDRHPLYCLVPMLALLLEILFGNRQFMTGDEPRYLLYAMSFIRHGTFVMPLAEWNRISERAAHLAATSLPAGGGDVVVMNGVYLPMILSPIAGLFSLAGVRMTTLLAGLAGLWVLHRLLRRVGGPISAMAALFIVAFSLPLLPYLHLFYMETFLFALVCWGWERLQTQGRRLAGDLLTAVILVAIPVVHMRGSVVAACLFLALLVQLVRRRLWFRTALVLAIAAAVGLAFIALNLRIYGAITGPVNTARPPKPAEWFSVLSMQLSNVHHGLLVYAPIWIVGYAGLACALAWRRRSDPASQLLLQGLLLAIIAAVTGVGVNPGECWPARFWVLSLPMLALGLAYWLHRMRGVLPVACLAVLLAVTAANTKLFVSAPNQFLEDRQTSTTYTALFDRYGHADANLVLPVETGTHADIVAARDLTLAAVSVTVLLALALRVRMAALFALLIVGGVFDLARAHKLAPTDYALVATPTSLSLTLSHPTRHPAIAFGREWQTWFVPPGLERFTVTSVGSRGQIVSSQAANQMVVSGCRGPTRTMSISTQDLDLRDQAVKRFKVLESDSVLRRWFTGGPC